MSVAFFLKLLHLTGAVVFLGDIVVTAVWKWFADRSGKSAVIAFSSTTG